MPREGSSRCAPSSGDGSGADAALHNVAKRGRVWAVHDPAGEFVNLWRALPEAECRNVLAAAHLATRIAAELQRVQRGAAPSRGEEPAA